MFDLNYYGTEVDLPAGVKEPLPDLCHKCGRCCKSATTYHSHAKLQAMAAEGHQDAVEFLSIFQPYPSLEAAREAVPDQVDQVMDVVRRRSDMNMEDLTFYHCPHVTPEGLCGIYDRRPRCCREAPAHGWSVMPPGCGYEGWQFEQREKQKRMIRDLKTSSYIINQMSPDGKTHPTRPDTTLKEMNEMVEAKIKPWNQFGAQEW